MNYVKFLSGICSGIAIGSIGGWIYKRLTKGRESYKIPISFHTKTFDINDSNLLDNSIYQMCYIRIQYRFKRNDILTVIRFEDYEGNILETRSDSYYIVSKEKLQEYREVYRKIDRFSNWIYQTIETIEYRK